MSETPPGSEKQKAENIESGEKINHGPAASRKVAAVSAFRTAGVTFNSKLAEKLKGNNKQPTENEEEDLDFPPMPDSKAIIAENSAIEARAHSFYPVQSYNKLNFSVNAGPGGGAALLLITRFRNEYTSAHIQLVRCGSSGNNFETVSLAKTGAHTVYNYDVIYTNSAGDLCPMAIYGASNTGLLSNLPQYGNCECGVLLQGSKEGVFKTKIEVSEVLDFFSLLALCSGPPIEGKTPSNAYLIQSEPFSSAAFLPDKNDLWKFTKDDDGFLKITGPQNSSVLLFFNSSVDLKSKVEVTGEKALVNHMQSFVGSEETSLLSELKTLPNGGMFVLCSHGDGEEDDKTTSALYLVGINKSNIDCTFIHGMSGSFTSGDAWKIYSKDDSLVAVGPAGPCRYSIISNIASSIKIDESRLATCLLTGEARPIRTGFIVDGDKIMGWITKACKIKLLLNGKVLEIIPIKKLLKQPDGRFGFCRVLSEEDKKPGLKFIQAFAFVKDINGVDKLMQFEGSPHTLTIQPKGVHVAINLGGPAYESLSGIVFADTQTLFKMHDEYGLQGVRKFVDIVQEDGLTAIIGNTHDGFIGGTSNSTHPEYLDEMKFEFDIPNGSYNVRLYGVSKNIAFIDDLLIQDENVADKVTEATEKIQEKVPGLSLKFTDIETKVENNKLKLFFGTVSNGPGARPSALVVTDKTYVEPKLTEMELAEEAKSKVELANNLVPLDRAMSKKEIKIAGWSSNLLENASGETADMTGWNYAGDWVIHSGGDNTETKFVASHMTCEKNQEINLLSHFSAEHLDSCPEIQASESFRAGTCGGGFYSLTVTLMNADGDTIAKKTTDEQGSIEHLEWIRECFTFKDYGKGLRLISFQTTGRDDKGWAGHFGVLVSTACLRVKSETTAAAGDVYKDVIEEESDKSIDQIVRGLLEENNETLTELQQDEEEESVVDFNKPLLNRANDSLPVSKPVARRTKKKRREVRVFVSSTFRDFQEEREVLIKKAFRELNRMCTERGICFTYVDLRWGITQEQSKDGQTISICLREIDKCRPYFICLLGERYGWCQRETVPDTLLDKTYDVAIDNYSHFDWIDKFRFNTSVTRLEALYGALRGKEAAMNRSFFYIREQQLDEEDMTIMKEIQEEMEAKDKAAKEKVETEKQEKSGKKEETKSADEQQTEEKKKPEVKKAIPDSKKGALESLWHYNQQQEFRKVVEDSGMNVRRYRGADEAHAKILEDLTRCVDEDFPPGTELTGLQREKEAHVAFAEVRCRIYIGREDYFTAIDDHVAKDTDVPFVVLGRSGSGKSALIANWCTRYEEKHQNDFVFMHFIGSSAESASHLNLLRRLYEEMKQFFNFPQAVPSSDRNLVLDLPSWLKQAGNSGNVMIVLDALNQLDTGAGATGDELELKWLPKTLPNGVKMVLSTLPGTAYDAVVANEWPTFEIFPLQSSEKKQIITEYMTLYAKTLSEEQMNMILNANQTSNPLYLKSLMDEIRMYGEFFQLTSAIKSYLSADSPGELFVKILERLENDFETGSFERPGLVRDTTTAIWCSNKGMTEAELTEYLQVTSRIWSPFYLSLEENVINRNGVLNFFHDHLRQAVERKYLNTPELKRQCYIDLANFFNRKDIDDRYTEEVPFLFSQAGDLRRLRATILNIVVFQRMMATEEGKFELIKAWQLLGGYEQVEEAYVETLAKAESWETTKDKASLIRSMAGFFMQLGLQKGARSLYERLLEALENKYKEEYSTIVYHHRHYTYKRQCVHLEVLEVIIQLGLVCRSLGELDDARKYLYDVISRMNKIRTPAQKLQLVKALLGLGSVLRLQEKAEQAKGYLKRAQEIATDILGKNHHYVAAIVGQIGELSYGQGRLEDGLIHHLWDMQLTQNEVGLSHPRVGAILNNIALVYDDRNDKLAGDLFKGVLKILVQAFGQNHVDVAIVRFNLGAFLFANNLYERARYQFDEALRIFQLFLGDDHPETKSTTEALEKLKNFSK
ncbi:uncharacterized protein [Antedon mediterranea]|uniref:uncharacterized protein n=1 Tax=Antedon mediterranea TaxID=105859 RepID=UPI003AF7FDC6